ncbi:MAG: outer membrane lipoprotein-sorting protein [Pseudobdellovibrio sp.]
MKKIFVVLFLLMNYAHAADQAAELLEASDLGRGGFKDGIEWTAKVESQENGDKTEREFLIKSKDHDAYIEAVAPAKNKGEIFLFNDRVMWFFKPSLKKPVSISARQKLTGQAANGDIASTHYARDYTATLEKTENLNGVKHYVLMLKAKGNNLTYDQIRYWISDKTKLATQAEFLTLQGKPFKMGYLEYKNNITVGGKTIPFVSQLKIVDSKYPDNWSAINYTKPKIINPPDSLFNYNNMTR